MESDKTSAVDFGSEKFVVEYDSWKNRDSKDHSSGKGVGYNACSASIFVPCRTNDTTGIAPLRSLKPSQKGRGNKKNKAGHANKKADRKKTGGASIKTEPGYDINEYSDYYWDLDEDIQQGRFLEIEYSTNCNNYLSVFVP